MWHNKYERRRAAPRQDVASHRGASRFRRGWMKRRSRAEDPGGLVKNRDRYNCQRTNGNGRLTLVARLTADHLLGG